MTPTSNRTPPAPKSPPAVFTLVQLSDPHLGPLPAIRWRELASKRAIGYVNWRRGRGSPLGRRNLDALVADIRAHPPDHIAVTGDLINIGLRAEIEAARRWLNSLGDHHDITVVPGNHDAYIPGAHWHLEQSWQPFMSDDANPGGPVAFPFIRRRDNVAIVGVSTAVATAPFLATGRIRTAQSARLRKHLRALGSEGLFRIVLLHHPPAIGATDWHRRLIGAASFRRAVADAGAELVLHGHNHRTAIDQIDGPNGPVPVIGAASAGHAPRSGKPGGSYLRFRIAREADGFVCDMAERGRSGGAGDITVLSERRLIDRTVT
ncbi:MAG: metallophosphoesterase [Hyphomicrobiales bacterium]|nr:metallophosphoesterase [Hyphomicrobiales bacterium]